MFGIIFVVVVVVVDKPIIVQLLPLLMWMLSVMPHPSPTVPADSTPAPPVWWPADPRRVSVGFRWQFVATNPLGGPTCRRTAVDTDPVVPITETPQGRCSATEDVHANICMTRTGLQNSTMVSLFLFFVFVFVFVLQKSDIDITSDHNIRNFRQQKKPTHNQNVTVRHTHTHTHTHTKPRTSFVCASWSCVAKATVRSSSCRNSWATNGSIKPKVDVPT
jgi:hypothetical protein